MSQYLFHTHHENLHNSLAYIVLHLQANEIPTKFCITTSLSVSSQVMALFVHEQRNKIKFENLPTICLSARFFLVICTWLENNLGLICYKFTNYT